MNVRLLNGELVQDEDRYKCNAVKSNLSKFIVETHFTTKKHLEKVYGIKEDLRSSFTDSNTTTVDFMICTTICKKLKKKHNESVEHEENVKQKRLVDEKWQVKIIG